MNYYKMELDITIIGLIAMALCIIPLQIMYKSKRKNSLKITDALKQLANELGTELSTFDTASSFALGYTADNSHLLFNYTGKADPFQQAIPFSEISNCRLLVNRTSKKAGKETASIIDRIMLELDMKHGGKKLNLTLFNYDNFIPMYNELQLAHKWEIEINRLID